MSSVGVRCLQSLAAAGGAALRRAAPQPQVLPPAPARAPEVSDAVPDAKGVKRMVILRGLDKITGRAIDVAAPAGVPVRFGSLTITARYCYTVPPEEPPETNAFLQIDDGRPGEHAQARLLGLDVRLHARAQRARTSRLRCLGDHLQDRPAGTGVKDASPADLPPPPANPPVEVPPAAAPRRRATAQPLRP